MYTTFTAWQYSFCDISAEKCLAFGLSSKKKTKLEN